MHASTSTTGAVTSAAEAADVILRDGSTLRLRAPRAEDVRALLDFLRGLSERSLYLRFAEQPQPGSA